MELFLGSVGAILEGKDEKGGKKGLFLELYLGAVEAILELIWIEICLKAGMELFLVGMKSILGCKVAFGTPRVLFHGIFGM